MVKRRGATLVAILAGLLAWTMPPASAVEPNNHGIIPPQASPHGASYAAWSVRWWQWAYETPVHGPQRQVTPLLAGNGTVQSPAPVDCSYGQKGHVWFLGGTYQPSFPNGGATPSYFANRSCTVSAGTMLFFPVINSEWDNLNVVGKPPLANTLDQLRSLAKGDIDGITSMSATVDGRPVRGLSGPDTPYRAVPTKPFFYTLPADNLPTAAFGARYDGTVPRPGAVADGVFLMVAPLSVGAHVLHWQGTAELPEAGHFAQDITYHITVLPERSKALP